MSIVIIVEYDLSERLEDLKIKGQTLKTNGKKARRTYMVKDTNTYNIVYNRHNLHARRNTGMNVTWYYTDNNGETLDKYLDVADRKYREDNRDFTRLANLIHDQGPQIEEKLLKLHISCNFSEEKSNLLAEYENVSSEAVYSDVSEETLAMAAKIYFRLQFCPDSVTLNTVKFYRNLFETFPVRVF